MSDLISRQAVLDILSCRNSAWDAYEKIVHLPSAQPESSQCWGCNCPKMQKTFSEMVHLHDAEDGE